MVMCAALIALFLFTAIRPVSVVSVRKTEDLDRIQSMFPNLVPLKFFRIASGHGLVEISLLRDQAHLEVGGRFRPGWKLSKLGPRHSSWGFVGLPRQQLMGFGVINQKPLPYLPMTEKITEENWGYSQVYLTVMTGSFRAVWLPYWFLILPFAPLPAMRLYQRIRTRRRTARGLCVKCGYDLRGAGATCPECGVMR